MLKKKKKKKNIQLTSFSIYSIGTLIPNCWIYYVSFIPINLDWCEWNRVTWWLTLIKKAWYKSFFEVFSLVWQCWFIKRHPINMCFLSLVIISCLWTNDKFQLSYFAIRAGICHSFMNTRCMTSDDEILVYNCLWAQENFWMRFLLNDINSYLVLEICIFRWKKHAINLVNIFEIKLTMLMNVFCVNSVLLGFE